MSGDAKSPAKLCRPEAMAFTPRFAYGHMAEAAVVTGPADGTELGSGFVRMKNARIPWTTRYDEVVLVVEGALAIELPTRTLSASTGEAIWLPAGTALTYVAERALCFYAIHPANWAQGLDLATVSE